MKHVVMFSGGLGSWAAAKRVAAEHGTADMVLLFTDVRMEDKDLYRFLAEAAPNVGVALTTIAEGRNPWHVFFDERFLGNSRADPCSKILKRQMADGWLDANCDPADTRVYVGIDWSEEHRYTALRDRRAADGWTYLAPLCLAPFIDKADVAALLKAEGIRAPRLYEMGFAHNNCGGFCIKAGQGTLRQPAADPAGRVRQARGHGTGNPHLPWKRRVGHDRPPRRRQKEAADLEGLPYPRRIRRPDRCVRYRRVRVLRHRGSRMSFSLNQGINP